MKADKWNPKTRTYIEVDIPDGKYPSFTPNMDEPCTCPSCGKTFKFGDMYSSHEYFYSGGVFSMNVCEECNDNEWERGLR